MNPMVNEDIVKCKHCNESLIMKKFDSHKYSPLLSGNTIKAELLYYIIVDNQKDDPTILAKDMYGTLVDLQ